MVYECTYILFIYLSLHPSIAKSIYIQKPDEEIYIGACLGKLTHSAIYRFLLFFIA